MSYGPPEFPVWTFCLSRGWRVIVDMADVVDPSPALWGVLTDCGCCLSMLALPTGGGGRGVGSTAVQMKGSMGVH